MSSRPAKDYKPNKADWLDGRWSHLDKNEGDEYMRGETAISARDLWPRLAPP